MPLSAVESVFLFGFYVFTPYFAGSKAIALETKTMKAEKRIWLVTTEHLEDGVWFREEQDFVVGMNYVAVLAASSPVAILAFILMSKHVHFVLLGKRDDAREFINEFKRRFSKYLQYKYRSEKALKNNPVDIKLIPFEEEAAERAIAYVQMNCVAANICLQPTQYPWGTGNLFFNAAPQKGVRLDSMSERACFRLLHTRAKLPGHWLVGEDGYILPSSYVRVDYVERIFRNPKRMDYFLRNSSKAKLRLESKEDAQPSFKDEIVLAALPELCRTLFSKLSFKELSETQKTEVLRQLRFRFSSNIHQLARVVGLSYDETARLMDMQ